MRGPGQKAVLDRLFKSPVRARGIADGGEPAVEHVAHDARGLGGHQRRGLGLKAREIHLAEGDVAVAVDEPRHQGPAADIELDRARCGDRAVRDFTNALPLDQHIAALARLRRAAVHDVGVAEKKLVHPP